MERHLMDQPAVIFVIELPGSGKTTAALDDPEWEVHHDDGTIIRVEL
jgi:hypothetical protein